MATIGNSGSVVTLTAAERNATITGTIDAFGSVGVFNGLTLDAAVFGPATTSFTLVNAGLVESFDTFSNADFGIILAAPGTIKNTGSIIADRGIAIFGTAAGAYIDNTKLIHGTEGYGIYVEGSASIRNTGLVEDTDLSGAFGGAAAIILQRGGGSVTNAGTITGPNGINFENPGTGAATAYVHNTGTITAFNTLDLNGNFATGFIKYGIGVYSDITGEVVNGGSISGNHVGVVFERAIGTVQNTGHISAASGYGVYLNVGGTVSNTGTIYGFSQGMFVGEGATTNVITNSGLVSAVEGAITTANYVEFGGAILEIGPGTITNTGTVSDPGAFGISLLGESFGTGVATLVTATIINTGLVRALYGIDFAGLGGVDNGGTILATDFGVAAYSTVGQILNTGLIEETAGVFIDGTFTQTGAGVLLRHGGVVTNSSTGTIIATGGDGIEFAAGGSLNNAGAITGHYGVELTAGGTVKNTGTINGADFGIFSTAPTGFTSVNNSGLIEATAKSLITIGTLTFSAVGIDVYGSGTITNTASIIGVGEGIFLGPSTASDLIVNSGLIDATGTTIVTASGTVGSVGVFLLDGGTINNKAGGTIIGYAVGVDSGQFLGALGERSRNSTVATSITNSGVIEGSPSTITFSNGSILSSAGGVALVAGGALTNEATGTISGHFGVYLSGGASDITNTIDNLGTIEGFSDFGVILGQNASLANSGLITGSSYGVFAYAANQITNQSGGVISGGVIGIVASNTFGETSTIANSGHILATYDGVILTAGGAVDNAGLISATSAGIVTTDDAATIDNTGTIITSTATYNNGIDLIAGGLITNAGLMEGGSGIFTQEGGTIVNSGSIIVYLQGIALNATGTVSNSGLIDVTKSGYNSGIQLNSGGIATNTGTIEAGTGFGLQAGGTVVNKGTITGRTAIYLEAGGTAINDGLITSKNGIFTREGGTIINAGTMIGGGIYLTDAGAVSNSGFIDVTASGYYPGINLHDGGLVTNTGTIESGTGIILQAGGTAVNDGKIAGRNGIFTKAGGTVTNAGTIDASNTGIIMNAGGTVIDTGLISIGSTGFAAIYFDAGFSATSRLIISATAKFTHGTVQLNGGALEFAADGKTVGTFAPESLEIINAGSITIDTGAIWDIAGTFTNGSNGILINDGTIKEGATDLISFNGPIEGTGLIELGKKPLTVESTVAATQKLEFTGTGDELVIGDAKDFHAAIEKFTLGETIDLAGVTHADITGTHFAKGVLTLAEAAGAITITFASPATFGSDVFVLTTDGAGTAITLAKPAMTILTPTTPPAAVGLSDSHLPIGTTMTATPGHLTGLTMFVPGNFGCAPQLLQTAAAIPPITLQP
jgi:hypothetical protein